MNEDFTTLHNKLHPDPEQLTPGQRRNKKYPTPQEILDLLRTLNGSEYREDRTRQISADATYYAAHNNSLIACDGTAWSSGSAYRRHKLTDTGLRYLRWLEAKPQPHALTVVPCRAIIPYGYDKAQDTLAQWMQDYLFNEWMLDRQCAEPVLF